MTDERWRRIEDICHDALERAPDDRVAFVREACSGDDALRAEVESLLANQSRADALGTGLGIRDSGLGTRTQELIGKQIGVYRIDSLLGAGGMGEVYRARDTKLGRDVALKILPAGFTSDGERLARFEREARLLASLNHPHIGGIYGFEESNGAPALVLELVEGRTLVDRVAQGPISLNESLEIARQIADALDAAHERGIVHRDLKPANIKITPDGVVKVLDFGLAKVFAGDASGPDLTQSPTVTVGGTRGGIILGTAAYMSPEQARGQPVDKRTDIWAFGCVLYEMLSGRSPFARATIADTLAAVVEPNPDWTQVPPTTPASVRWVIQRCLEKDPKQRLRDIADARPGPSDVGALNLAGQAAVAGRSPRREYLAWSIAAIAVAGVGIALWSERGPEASPAPAGILRTSITLPANQRLATELSDYPLAVSPDGKRLAYVAEQEGQTQLYVRDLSTFDSKPIPGTSGARHPFFSPDGEWIGFFADAELRKVAAAGGTPLRICGVEGVSMGASWGPDGTIVWASRGADLTRVASGGGVPQTLAESRPATWPEILPDGKTILFTTGVAGEGSAIAAMSLDGGTKRIILRTTDSKLEGPAALGEGVGLAQVRFVPGAGYLTYGRSQDPGAVQALPFDPVSLTAKGSPVSLVGSVERGNDGGAVYFTVAARTGLLLYASTGDRHQLVWVDRSGTFTPVSPDRAAFRNPRLSPDGLRIAVAINDETRRSDIWIYDAQRGVRSRLRLTMEGHNLAPVWTPDGARITFSSDGRASLDPGLRSGVVELAVDNGTTEVLLPIDVPLRVGALAYPTSWSPNGNDLLLHADSRGLWSLARGGQKPPRRLLEGQFSANNAQFSPDGRWVVYASDETGRDEIYVRRYPEFDNPFPVSTDGGTFPRWSRDGREIFYRRGDAMMVAAVDTKQAFHSETPRRLFDGHFTGAGHAPHFDVAVDGKRFVMVRSDDASLLTQLTVVQNWFEDLKRLVPLK